MNPVIDPSNSSHSHKKRWAWLLRAPGKRANFLAVIATILFLVGLATPGGPFWLPEPNHTLFFDLLGFLISLILYFIYSGISLVTVTLAIPWVLVTNVLGVSSDAAIDSTGSSSGLFSFILFFLPLWLWFFVAVNWLIRGIASILAKLWGNGVALRPRSRTSWIRWAVAPVLILLLQGVWETQLPMKLAFSMQKPGLEQIADQAIAAASGEVIFEDAQRVGLAEPFAAYRLPLSNDTDAWEDSEQAQYEKKAADKSVASILIHTGWEHAGYVCDLSRKPDELTGTLFRLDPKSKFNYNQTLYYLGDGWYAYQNSIDW